MPCKLLYISTEACCSELARVAVEEGAEVRLSIECATDRPAADGFVSKVDDWRDSLDWADLVVFDDTMGRGALAEELRDRGVPVVGGSAWTDRLEDDRAFGQAALKARGIPTLPERSFARVEDAIAFVASEPARYVVKPLGEAAGRKSLTFVGEDEDGFDVRRVLAALGAQLKSSMSGVQLQRRAVGIEVAVGAFFDGQRFLDPINVNFEHKRLFPDNLGPLTGEMGTALTWCDKNTFFARTLALFEEDLRRERFHGYFDLNCIVNDEGAWPLEFTARFGFPTINVMLEGLKTPAVDLLRRLATGEGADLEVSTECAVGVRLRLPPYPWRDYDAMDAFARGAEISVTGDRRGMRIEDARAEGDRWISTSYAPLVVTGGGASFTEARDQAYERVSRVRIPNMFYRDDIGRRADAHLARLTALGWL